MKSADSLKSRAESSDEAAEGCSEKSTVAREIENLQSTVLRYARERERLPQPLFWSLFNSRLRDIKKTKELERLLRETLG
jgi:TATA-binding protein-associated factor Taf7